MGERADVKPWDRTWDVVPSSHGNGDIQAAPNGQCWIQVDHDPEFDTGDARWATADIKHATVHLIAAAPELFRALERAEKFMQTIWQDRAVRPHDGVLDEMHAALAKARGEA
jgi:hypothetical protein